MLIIRLTNRLFIIHIIFLLTCRAWSYGGYLSFSPRLLETDLRSSYFYSNQNYETSSGALESLPNSNSFKQLDFNMNSRYVVWPQWAFLGGLNYSSVESVTNKKTRTNAGISQYEIGAQYLLPTNFVELIPEVRFTLPYEKLSTTSDTVPNSEGANEIIGLLRAQKRYESIAPYGSLGLNYRSEGRSMLVPWSLGLQSYSRKFTFGGELFGFQSVTDDGKKENEGTSKDDRTLYISRVAGGSRKYYSYNPGVIDSNVYMSFNFTKWLALSVGAGTTLSGSKYAAGYHMDGVLSFNFDFSSKYDVYESKSQKSKMPQVMQGTDKEIEGFQEEVNDGVNQKLFTPEPRPSVTKPYRKKIQPPAMHKPRTQIPQPSLQDQLDATEMQIQLKQIKK